MDEYDIYPNLRDGKRMAKADKIETTVMTVLIILLAALLFCKYFVFETVIDKKRSGLRLRRYNRV